MSDMVLAEALTRLAIARGATLDELTLDVYATSLEDLPAETVRRACLDLGRQPRKDFESALPSVGTIRERSAELVRLDQVALEASRLLPMPQTDEDGPRYACLECRDTAWREFACAGRGQSKGIAPSSATVSAYPCARLKAHGPHTFAERCQCVDTNPVIARQREFMRERMGRKEIRDEVRDRPASRRQSQFTRVGV